MSAPADGIAIFVYGTLKRGQCRQRMWPRAPLSIRPGYVSGWLYDLGDYPAMWCADCCQPDTLGGLPSEPNGDWIEGEVWSIAEPDLAVTIEELDQIEETNQPQACNLYDRILVRVYEAPDHTAPSILAFAYQFSRWADLPAAGRIVPTAPHACVAWPVSP